MEVNLTAVLVAAVAMFIVGAVWYGVIFGSVWGKIHGFDKLSAKKQKEMQSQMAFPYLGQLVMTLIMAYVLAHFMNLLPEVELWQLSFWVWIGFVVWAQYGDLFFGGSPEGRGMAKFLITSVGSLVAVFVGVYVLSLF